MVNTMKKYAIVEDGKVINATRAVAPLADNWIETDDPRIGWLWDGQTFSEPPPPVKSPEELQTEIVEATQKRLDDFARTRNYDGILSACTYSDSLVQKFRDEGQYCLAARDNTWAKLYEMLAEVQAGTRPVPSGYDDIEPELPQLVWPN